MRIPVLLLVLLTAGCATDEAAAPAPGATPAGAMAGTFEPYRDGAAAITYDPAVVPPGATARLVSAKTAEGATVRLTVSGMVPGRTYGAHLHTKPCTAVPDAAGPHFQHEPGTAKGDPASANPRNEVWLDFTSDTAGAATAEWAQNWSFGATPPASLVLHAEKTRTAKGEAGTAGARVGCMTLP